jgi:hypothetical protein
MAANHQQKQRGRGPGRPFTRGQSGNPAGRPAGSRNKATEMAQALLDGQANSIVQKCIELAVEGNPAALKLCLERLVPRQARSVKLALPKIESAADIGPAMGTIAAAVADGSVAPCDAFELSRVIENWLRALEAGDFDRRLRELEGFRAARS